MKLSNIQIINLIKKDFKEEFETLKQLDPTTTFIIGKSKSDSRYLNIENESGSINLTIRVSKHKRKSYYKDCNWYDANEDYDLNLINFGVENFEDLLINSSLQTYHFDRKNYISNLKDYENFAETLEDLIEELKKD